MKTLVWVEHDGGAVKDATLSAVTAAAKLGEVHLLVAGEGVSARRPRRLRALARFMSLMTRPLAMHSPKISRR